MLLKIVTPHLVYKGSIEFPSVAINSNTYTISPLKELHAVSPYMPLPMGGKERLKNSKGSGDHF